MKNCRIVIFVTKCTEKVVKSLYFHGKIAVFQNPLVRARGNLSLGPCFSGCPDPTEPQKFCKMLAGLNEASKVICLAVRRLLTQKMPRMLLKMRDLTMFTNKVSQLQSDFKHSNSSSLEQ